MPNIEIIGYSPETAQSLKGWIDQTLGEIGLAEEAITTIVPATAQSCSPFPQAAPYLRVCSTKLTEIYLIIRELQKHNIYEEIEYQVLSGFLSKEQMIDRVHPEILQNLHRYKRQ